MFLVLSHAIKKRHIPFFSQEQFSVCTLHLELDSTPSRQAAIRQHPVKSHLLQNIRNINLMKGAFVPVAAFFCIIWTSPSNAQYYFENEKYYSSNVVFELGGSVGLMNCLTDLGGRKGIGKGSVKDLNWKVSKPAFSIYAMAMYKYALGVRLEATFGGIQEYDSILKKVAPTTFGRYERNLSFKSKITDIQLAAEIHPLFFKNYDENEAPYWSPYAIVGIGFFSFDPQAKLNGEWYRLQPLCIEGQGFTEYPDHKPYKLTQLNIPLGIGVRYEINSLLSARLEIIHRILFTDYLDDVSTEYIDPSLFSAYLLPAQASIAQQLYDRRLTTTKAIQRGGRSDKDAFFTVQLKIGIAIRSPRSK
jgi:hypothetical protein